MADTEATNKDVVRRFNEEFYNKGKIELIDELCDERYSLPFASIHGREQLKTAVRKAVADGTVTDRVTILEMIAEGDRVAVRAKHPDGREEAELYTLANGKIVEHLCYWGPEVPK